MNYIKNAIQLFKIGYEDTVYSPFTVTLISTKAWDEFEEADKNFYRLNGDTDLLMVIDMDHAEEAIPRIYGIIREHMLVVCIGCNDRIEEAVKNICTAKHNYRLLY